VGPARQLPRAEEGRGAGTVREAGLGRLSRAGSRAGERKRREEEQLGSGCVGGGLVAHLGC
jgi:hypothetical protein